MGHIDMYMVLGATGGLGGFPCHKQGWGGVRVLAPPFWVEVHPHILLVGVGIAC